jgi:hypothetical protein
MKQDRSVALARLGEELKRPPFHAVLRPRPVDVDPDSGTVAVALDYRDEWRVHRTTSRFTAALSLL